MQLDNNCFTTKAGAIIHITENKCANFYEEFEETIAFKVTSRNNSTKGVIISDNDFTLKGRKSIIPFEKHSQLL